MQKTPLSALSALALSLVLVMTESSQAHAQDQEEGAVEIDGSGAPAEPAPSAAPAPAEVPPEPTEQPEEPSEPARSGAGPGAWRAYAGARIGFGGTIYPKDAEQPYWARATPGFALGGDYVLLRYLALGLETRFDWTAIKDIDSGEPEDDDDGPKFMLWSLMAKPRARHVLKALPLEVYAALPFGLSITSPKQGGYKAKPGATLGLAAGANYFFNDHWGLNGEMGFTWHWMRFEGDRVPPVPGLSQTVLYKARFSQMALAINVLYAF